jgi:hypothetical protein
MIGSFENGNVLQGFIKAENVTLHISSAELPVFLGLRSAAKRLKSIKLSS